MRFLFCARPAYGHVLPLLPLAQAARRGGHEVSFATTGRFVETLPVLGLRTYDVGISIEDARDRLLESLAAHEMPKDTGGRPDMEIGGRLFIDVLAPRTIADLAPLLDRLEPDAVVYEQYDVGAAIAAYRAGIPAVCHSLSPRLPDDVLSLMAGDHLPRLWADHGGTPSAFDVFTGDAYLDLFPAVLQQPSFRDDPARVPVRPVPFSEPGAVLPGWVGERDRPLVYLTLGTVVSTDEVLRPIAEGLGRLDVDVLVALGSADGETLGPLPPNVHVHQFVDQPAVLRHADLAVHHGGSGTLLGCLTTGTRQILLPKGADQFFNADLMAAAGLAPVLEPAQATPEAVAAAVAAELTWSRIAAKDVREEIAAMPSPADALHELVARVERLEAPAA